MPNFFSAFTSEVFRPIATLLIPGAIGISTWLVALLWCFNNLKRLVASNHTESSLLILLAMIFAGMVFEDMGSRYEASLDNHTDRRTNNLHSSQWFDYLRTAFRADPIGRRYLRSLVLRLKFELGVAFSMVSAALGLIWLVALGLSCKAAMVTGLVCLLFMVWGLVEARGTHRVIASIRAELLKEIRIVGS